MKTLEDIKSDMSLLYDQVRDGNTDVKQAAELANIAGKFLKAEQLQLAREIFLNNHRRGLPLLPNGNDDTPVDGVYRKVKDGTILSSN